MRVTNVGLPELKGLSKLERLHLCVTGVTDAGLEQIKAIANLKVLNFGSTKVTDAGLKHLKELKSRVYANPINLGWEFDFRFQMKLGIH